MFSNFRALFGKKPAPDVADPMIERTQWFVAHPLHWVTFENKTWALEWCSRHGVAPQQLQERTLKLDTEKETAQTNILTNMLERVKEGLPMGSMANIPPDMSPQHLDNFFDSFKMQPQIDATAPLLSLAFSVNRTDVAQYIGGLLERSFEAWLTPYESVPYQDPEIVDDANKAFYKGFKELMTMPRQMQWLFENNTNLKTKVESPDSWILLEKAVKVMPNESRVMWPIVAHTVFGNSVHPVASHWRLDDPNEFIKLTLSFAHDPAAQCSLIHQAKSMPWFADHHSMRISPNNISDFVCRESLQLRALFSGRAFHSVEANVTARVSLLELGLEETTPPEEFYQHARAVFNPQQIMTLALPELEMPHYV